MTLEQALAAGIMVAALVLFAWDRWRHDVVAGLVLMLGLAAGLVPYEDAFSGFAHPAVITVAAVLAISKGLESSGLIALLGRKLVPPVKTTHGQITLYSGVGAALSAVMNNVGALAMTMPLAIAAARRANIGVGRVLMPLAFATVLGGTVTLIGTPPNLIVAAQRRDALGESYGLFDFAWAGLPIAVLGLLFLAFVGWRLIPNRAGGGNLAIEGPKAFITEFAVTEESPLIDLNLDEVRGKLEPLELTLLGAARGQTWIPYYATWQRLVAGDGLIVEAEPGAIAELEGKLGLTLEGKSDDVLALADKSDVRLAEVVLVPHSAPLGATAAELRLRSRYLVNLLAVGRKGARHHGSLRTLRFAAGDVLLLQGPPGQLQAVAQAFNALPLAERGIDLVDRHAPWVAALSFLAALASVTLGLLPPEIALSGAVLSMVLFGAMKPRQLYEGIDWTVIVLLAAMMPIGTALETTGLSEKLAGWLVHFTADLSPLVSLAGIIVLTMLLSDLLNNAVTVVIMGPIAITVAQRLDVATDPFLMGVAIGASCAFLTPIGHQNNTLVMGPGGYRFGDYWRVGLPLEALCLAVAMVALPLFWPL